MTTKTQYYGTHASHTKTGKPLHFFYTQTNHFKTFINSKLETIVNLPAEPNFYYLIKLTVHFTRTPKICNVC